MELAQDTFKLDWLGFIFPFGIILNSFVSFCAQLDSYENSKIRYLFVNSGNGLKSLSVSCFYCSLLWSTPHQGLFNFVVVSRDHPVSWVSWNFPISRACSLQFPYLDYNIASWHAFGAYHWIWAGLGSLPHLPLRTGSWENRLAPFSMMKKVLKSNTEWLGIT